MVERWNKLTVADEDTEFLDKYNSEISDGSIPNVEDDNKTYDKEKYDIYVNVELVLPRQDYDGLMHAIVQRPKLGNEGKSVGKNNNIPLLDTIAYKIEFDDGTTEFITANIISDNLLEKVNEEGRRQILLYRIIL